MMHQSFWWGPNVGDVFIKGLTVDGTGAMVALCLSLIVLSIVYEGLKVHGARVRARAARERRRAASCSPSESATLLSLEPSSESFLAPISKRICSFVGEASVFLFHNGLGYALMLTVMIYNGFLFIAVVLGMTIGYFIFGHISMKMNMENVQARQTNVICTSRSTDTAESSSSNSRAPYPSSTSTSRIDYQSFA